MATETITLKLVATDLMSGNVTKAISGLDKLAQRGGLVGSVMQGVGQSFGQMLNPVGLVTNAIGGVVDALGDATKAFREDEVSQAQLRTALEANIDAWDGNTEAIEKVIAARMDLGFSDDEQRASLAQLVAQTKDVNKALDIQRTAMDLARLRSMNLADATALLGKVAAGNVSVLSRYGIKLREGATATEAMAEVQKRAAGQAEAYGETSAGAAAKLDVKVGELQESIGRFIDGPATALIGFFDDLLTRLAPSGASSLPPRIQLLIDQFKELEDVAGSAGGLGQTKTSLEDIRKAMDEVAFANQQRGGILGTGAMLEKLGPEFLQLADSMGVTVQQMGSLVRAGIAAGKTFEEIRSAAFAAVNDTTNATTSMVDAWTLGMKYMGEAAEETGQDIKAGLVRPVKRSFAEMFQTMAEARDPWRTAWKQMAAWAKNPFDPDKFEDYIAGRARAASRKARQAFGAERKRWQEIASAYRWIAKQEWIDPMTADLEAIMAGLRTASRMTAGAAHTTIQGTDWQLPGNNAQGTSNWRGGWSWVGEEGPELMKLPRGTQIKPADESARMAGDAPVHLHFHGLVAAPSEADGQRIARMLMPALQQAQRRAGVA